MTNERAINTLNSLKDYYNDKNEDSYVGFDSEDNEALEMAIKALKIMQGIEDAYMAELFKTPLERGDKISSCEDCISRADILALAEKGTLVSNGNYQAVCKAINGLPSVQPQRGDKDESIL